MKTLRLTTDDPDLDFASAKRLADAAAEAELGENMCLSWYDRAQDREAPANASECHDETCPIPGYIEYAMSRGAQLMVDVGDGAYVYCYHSLAEYEF
jgi:hypothetical protein